MRAVNSGTSDLTRAVGSVDVDKGDVVARLEEEDEEEVVHWLVPLSCGVVARPKEEDEEEVVVWWLVPLSCGVAGLAAKDLSFAETS